MVLSYRVRERDFDGRSFRRHVRPCYSSINDQLLGLRDHTVSIVIYLFFLSFSFFLRHHRIQEESSGGGYALPCRESILNEGSSNLSFPR